MADNKLSQDEIEKLHRVMLAEGPSYQSTGPPLGAAAPTVLTILWLLGTTGFLGWTLVRTIRFRRTLTRASCQAPASLQRQAAAIRNGNINTTLCNVYFTIR